MMANVHPATPSVQAASPDLAQVQATFQAYLLGQDSDMAPLVANRPGISTEARLAIYHNAYRVRLHDALASSFEQTCSYLGDGWFYGAAMAYIEATPSQTSNLRWYGASFPAFLARHFASEPEVSPAGAAMVAELAAFEWALGMAFDAEDQSVLTLADLATIDDEAWGHIGFDTQASMQFLSLHTNCTAVWLALGEDNTPPDPECSETAQSWLVWRKGLQPHFRSISADEQQALLGLQGGQSFADVCDNLPEDATEQVAMWLQTWIRDGLLRQIRSSV